MNVELLKRVATKLRRMRHKKHFEMRTFAEQNSCGTAACVFGHALLMAGYKIKFDEDGEGHFISPEGDNISPFDRGAVLLELDADTARRLANPHYWPKEFGGSGGRSGECSDYQVFNNPKIAAARIDHFIATKGKE